jgi:uncharacterized membrane protein YidH (DUF202 family)
MRKFNYYTQLILGAFLVILAVVLVVMKINHNQSSDSKQQDSIRFYFKILVVISQVLLICQ